MKSILLPLTTLLFFFSFLSNGKTQCTLTEVSTVAGTLGTMGSADGQDINAQFLAPQGIAIGPNGNIYVADQTIIRKITPTGLVTTVAGQPGISGYQDGVANTALFDNINDIVVDQNSNIYVADYSNFVIRKVTPAGTVTTLAGTQGNGGYSDGLGTAAMFNGVTSLAIDAAGNVYASDLGAHTIRKITPLGLVTTVAGTAGYAGSLDGIGLAARFSGPGGVAITNTGIIYVADRGNNTIRKIDATGQVTTFAGSTGLSGFVDGNGNTARFNSPNRVSVDQTGNVIVADRNNSAIRIIAPNGDVSTLSGGTYGYLDGPIATAQFAQVEDVAVDVLGNMYISDGDNYLIRKIGTCTSVSPESTAIPTMSDWGLIIFCLLMLNLSIAIIRKLEFITVKG